MKTPAFAPRATVAMLLALTASAAAVAQAPKKFAHTWLSADDPTLPADYAIQGEYLGATAAGDNHGAQVIALDGGAFHAVILPGGLPGAGWDGEKRILMDGKLEGDAAVFTPSKPPKQYIAKGSEKFCATRQFPPPGHREWTGSISGGRFAGKTDAGEAFSLKKTIRTSPTLGQKPPAGALVLFDGSGKDEWRGGRVDPDNGHLHTDAKDIRSVRAFTAYRIHLEFMTPFRPDKRSQGRGNSGFYQADGSEIQVLDSFGLEGLHNECGAIYGRAAPRVNMCFPPLSWQTYDVEFQRPADGGSALITVRHNGVLIHDKVPGRNRPSGTLTLQGHGNPLQYRNIWLVEE